jgi:hypothetical protein
MRGYAYSGSVREFKQKSIELEKNRRKPVKNFNNMDLEGILSIGLVKWREIGWAKNQGVIGKVNC